MSTAIVVITKFKRKYLVISNNYYCYMHIYNPDIKFSLRKVFIKDQVFICRMQTAAKM
jgi:hypothetical protein